MHIDLLTCLGDSAYHPLAFPVGSCTRATPALSINRQEKE
jgi:hypothetical protein